MKSMGAGQCLSAAEVESTPRRARSISTRLEVEDTGRKASKMRFDHGNGNKRKKACEIVRFLDIQIITSSCLKRLIEWWKHESVGDDARR
jgi:hypothetical protein